ncbi:NAD(P)H-dependent oxidoreductase [Falsirhodobacter xinxiangensis]|uniref:NAD(P)H-dependent oxidoreductase n=1 Tax=Falsirhodobacter xinxiangensis TaxID=2530049 RepID=UPI0010A9ED84|nr:NAD(P)H-dependent oxidoreductase [Rhodobacter xinxiangensis]
MPLRIAGFAGSFGNTSKTRALVAMAATQAAESAGGQAQVFDLGDLQPQLGTAGHAGDLTGDARRAFDSILAADALVFGSPVYKGSYGGMFKHFIDLIEPADLLGKPILLTATGGGDRHALVIEHQLRPLFAFFEAAVMPTGVYASAADFTDGVPTSPALLARLRRGTDQLAAAARPVRDARAA